MRMGMGANAVAAMSARGSIEKDINFYRGGARVPLAGFHAAGFRLTSTEPGAEGIMAKKKKSVSKSEKAGLSFPVARVNKHLKKNSGLKRVGSSALGSGVKGGGKKAELCVQHGGGLPPQLATPSYVTSLAWPPRPSSSSPSTAARSTGG